MGRKALTYNNYIESRVWECSDSPTGAHHWVQMVETEKLASGGYFRCKYCKDVERFPLTFSKASVASGNTVAIKEEYS